MRVRDEELGSALTQSQRILASSVGTRVLRVCHPTKRVVKVRFAKIAKIFFDSSLFSLPHHFHLIVVRCVDRLFSHALLSTPYSYYFLIERSDSIVDLAS